MNKRRRFKAKRRRGYRRRNANLHNMLRGQGHRDYYVMDVSALLRQRRLLERFDKSLK